MTIDLPLILSGIAIFCAIGAVLNFLAGRRWKSWRGE